MAYVLHVLRENDLFVDVGANVGSYTILACAAAGARGECFEPVPSTHARLLANLLINDLTGRVRCRNVGVSDARGQLRFTSEENCENHVLADGEIAAGAVTVTVLPLDELLAGESPALIKIDVEGYETAVVRGAREVLRSASLHSVIMEMGSGARYGFDENALLDTMRANGVRFVPLRSVHA